MNQPISSCQTYYEELLQIAETAGSPKGVESGLFPEDQPHKMDRSAGGSSPIFRSPTPMVLDKDPTEAGMFNSDTSLSHPFFYRILSGRI